MMDVGSGFVEKPNYIEMIVKSSKPNGGKTIIICPNVSPVSQGHILIVIICSILDILGETQG